MQDYMKYRNLAKKLDPMFNPSNVEEKDFTEKNALKVINLCIECFGGHLIEDKSISLSDLKVKTKTGVKPFVQSNFGKIMGFDFFPSGETTRQSPYNWTNFIFAVMEQVSGEEDNDESILKDDKVKSITEKINNSESLTRCYKQFDKAILNYAWIDVCDVPLDKVFKIRSNSMPIDYLDFNNPYIKLLTDGQLSNVDSVEDVTKIFNFLQKEYMNFYA